MEMGRVEFPGGVSDCQRTELGPRLRESEGVVATVGTDTMGAEAILPLSSSVGQSGRGLAIRFAGLPRFSSRRVIPNP